MKQLLKYASSFLLGLISGLLLNYSDTFIQVIRNAELTSAFGGPSDASAEPDYETIDAMGATTNPTSTVEEPATVDTSPTLMNIVAEEISRDSNA